MEVDACQLEYPINQDKYAAVQRWTRDGTSRGTGRDGTGRHFQKSGRDETGRDFLKTGLVIFYPKKSKFRTKKFKIFFKTFNFINLSSYFSLKKLKIMHEIPPQRNYAFFKQKTVKFCKNLITGRKRDRFLKKRDGTGRDGTNLDGTGRDGTRKTRPVSISVYLCETASKHTRTKK